MKDPTWTASTTMWAKKSDSESTIFEDMAVFAAFSSVSFPRLAVSMDRCSSIYLQACRTGVAASQDGPSCLRHNHPPMSCHKSLHGLRCCLDCVSVCAKAQLMRASTSRMAIL